MMSEQEKLKWAKVVNSMSVDFMSGKINWDHYVETLCFTTEQIKIVNDA